MLTVGFILLFLAYTAGIVALVLEILCYRKGIEYLETILFTIAFLLVIFAISLSCFLEVVNEATLAKPSNFMNLAFIALGLTAPFNVYAERQMNMSSRIRYLLFGVSALLTLLLVLQMIFNFSAPIHLFINAFLAISILYSMVMVRRSEPGIHIKHQEKIERSMSTAIITVLPFFLLIEFYNRIDVPMTISVFFIILAVSKIFDNIKRLSLLKPVNAIELKEENEYGLTPREQEVADYLVKGHTYAKIAEDLYISMPTVKTHVSNTYRKVGVKNKMELFYALTK